jgi:hypothetical protein
MNTSSYIKYIAADLSGEFLARLQAGRIGTLIRRVVCFSSFRKLWSHLRLEFEHFLRTKPLSSFWHLLRMEISD